MKPKQFLPIPVIVGAGLAVTRLLFAKNTPTKSSPNHPPYDAIDTFIEQQMQRLHIPGASLAIVKGKRIVYQRGFGEARPGGETPTSQTPFFIGSITKSITALGIMQLTEAGKIELDAPVQRYLPWFRLADPVASSQITVRHLLNQTSGLPLWPSEADLDDYDDRPVAVERKVRELSTLKITRPVGTKFEYSNFNYNILGLIIEAASGERYADYIQHHIFDPLEMRHSYSSKAAAHLDGLAVGYRHWFSLPFPAPNTPVSMASLPSGQLISCAEDLTHYLIAHINQGEYRNSQLLSPSGMDEMHRGAKEVVMFGISGGSYGMGWFDIDIGGIKTYSHGGTLPDFSAFMVIIPEQKKGIILLLNADPYGLPVITEEIGMGVTALLAGQQPPPIKLDFIQWIFRLLPLIPILQLAGVILTLGSIRYWKRNPASRPSQARMWRQHILLPMLPNLTLVALWAYLRSTGLLRFFQLFMPDLAWIVKISGLFATLWAGLRTGLICKTLQKPDS